MTLEEWQDKIKLEESDIRYFYCLFRAADYDP